MLICARHSAVYLDLYVPSTVRWIENGAAFSLTQQGQYPYEERIVFTVKSSQAAELTMHFRIPTWAQGAEIFVNGTRQKELAQPGSFAAIRREWKTGDRVELEFPLRMRLESIDAKHADTVALLRGPLVLLAVKADQTGPLPKVTREQLLAARRVNERTWQVDAANGAVTMLPFTWMGSRPYSTYLKLS